MPLAAAFIQLFALHIPGLLGGSLILESLFGLPGVGSLFYEALLTRDYPLIINLNLLFALIIFISGLIADGFAWLADARLRQGG
jgi:peptide/nickel transport system permease protein